LLGFETLNEIGGVLIKVVQSIDRYNLTRAFTSHFTDATGQEPVTTATEIVPATTTVTMPDGTFDGPGVPSKYFPWILGTLINQPLILTKPLSWLFSGIKWVFFRKKKDSESTSDESIDYTAVMLVLSEILSNPLTQAFLFFLLLYVVLAKRSLDIRPVTNAPVSRHERLSVYPNLTKQAAPDKMSLTDNLSLDDVEDIYLFIITSLHRNTVGDGLVSSIMEYCRADCNFDSVDGLPSCDLREKMVRQIVNRFLLKVRYL
jgi:hypothetical protein